MQFAPKEEKPVIYSAGATRALSFGFEKGSQCFTMHWHERLEILRVVSGTLEYTLGSEKGLLKSGQVLVIPPRMAHHGRAHTDVHYDVLMFDLRYFYNGTQVCKNILTAIFEGRTEFQTQTGSEQIVQCVDSICHTELPDSIELVSKVYHLLHLFLQHGVIKVLKNGSGDSMREVIDYIESEYVKELTTASLAEKFGYTGAHFCRKFKKVTGLTPVAYIKIFRLEKAFSMLKGGEGRISEIAQRCGFSDSNYFTRCFTAHFGNPPSYYIVRG